MSQAELTRPEPSPTLYSQWFPLHPPEISTSNRSRPR
jgi:hypothetical protein